MLLQLQQERAPAPAPASAYPTPPPGFEEYKQHGSKDGVIMLLEQITANARALEAEALHAEQNAKDAYLSFVNETTRSVEAKESSIVDRRDELAKLKEDATEAKRDHGETITDLENL